jgi:nitrate reductase NapE component
MSDQERVRPSRPRWGVRSLLWLTLALVCVLTSNVLSAAGNDDWVLVTFVGTVGGLAGAAYCSIRGLASAGWLR